MWIYNYNCSNELYHYGVKGIKWGVRRYRNYPGSYTRAGVKRFDDSMDKYGKADTRYKNAKASYKQSKTADNKIELTNSRMVRKQAKMKLNKDYAHLRQDKLGDWGKDLYSRGKTISGNRQATQALATIGSASLSALAYNRQMRLVDEKFNKVLAGIGGLSIAAASANEAITYSQNKKLRAYYSHTSNY